VSLEGGQADPLARSKRTRRGRVIGRQAPSNGTVTLSGHEDSRESGVTSRGFETCSHSDSNGEGRATTSDTSRPSGGLCHLVGARDPRRTSASVRWDCSGLESQSMSTRRSSWGRGLVAEQRGGIIPLTSARRRPNVNPTLRILPLRGVVHHDGKCRLDHYLTLPRIGSWLRGCCRFRLLHSERTYNAPVLQATAPVRAQAGNLHRFAVRHGCNDFCCGDAT